eukprot:gene10371-10529_t
MKVIALVSGGKDSCYSMHLCAAHGHEVVALGNLLPPDSNTDELDSYMYQTVGHQLVAAYASCTGLPLYRRRIMGISNSLTLSYSETKGDEVEDLLSLLAFIQQQHPEVQAVATGAIASDYQRLRVENVCSRLGLVSLAYLWHQPQDQLLSDMVANDIEAVLVKVAAIGLDPQKHLGKSIRQLLPTLRRLRERYGCNVCGEGGEYETLTLDCPAFRHGRIVLDDWQVILHSPDSIAPVGILHPTAFHIQQKQGAPTDSSTEAGAASCSPAAVIPMAQHFGAANEEYCKHLPSVNPPARACVQVPLPAGCPVLIDVLFANPSHQQQQAGTVTLQRQQPQRRVLHVQSISSWAPSCIGPYSQATACNGLIYMAGQIPLEPASMAIRDQLRAPTGTTSTGSSSARIIAAQVWRTLLSCQAVAVAIKSCVASAALGLTVYLADSAVGGQHLMQTALEAIWADGSLLDKQDMPPALLAAAAALETGRCAGQQQQQPGHLQQAAVQEAAQDSSSSNAGMADDNNAQQEQEEEEEEQEQEEEAAAVVDDYLLPPLVLQCICPAVVYVSVPALPKGAPALSGAADFDAADCRKGELMDTADVVLHQFNAVFEKLMSPTAPAVQLVPVTIPSAVAGYRLRKVARISAEAGFNVPYTRDNRRELIATPVVTEPGLDSRRSLRSNKWPQKSSLFLFRTDGLSCSRELVTGTGRFQFAHPSTQQHLLVWRDRPKVVMIIKKLGSELNNEFFSVVSYLMETERMHVVVEPHMYDQAASAGVPTEQLFTFVQGEQDRLADYVDFVVCLGGDGVILHASSLFRRHIPPVLSFHLGSMGFLANHTYQDFKRELRQVIYGYQKLDTCSMDSLDLPPTSNSLGVMITLRMRLQCSVVRAGHQQPEQVYEVLNEIVVDRGSNSFLTNIEAYIGGRFITRVQADGIMLATPTGSTAYSVAAGGSMVHPNVQAILLTPICPHSLNFRPIILPDYIELELRVPDSARVGAWVCFDGKQRQELQRGDSVFIKMSENPVPTINKTDLTTDWFESLERCFRPLSRPGMIAEEMMLQANGGVPPMNVELHAPPASPATAASSGSARVV